MQRIRSTFDTAGGRIAALVAFGLVAVAALQQPASAGEPRHAAMILDANTGTVLHDHAGDELRHPASLTKMMTLYMTFELIEMGRLSYNSKIKVTQEAAAAAPSKLDLEPGEEIAVIDAIKALVTKSANDMAVALAQHIGGSEANFARLMTERARQLGMSKTVFRNASGLPDPSQVTTARDMITLGLRLQDDFPKHYPLFGLKTFSYNGHSHRNHNTLLLSYRGTDGIKTGYTHASGFNLVASVRRDGKHLVGAIFGGASAGSRNAQLRALFERSFPRGSTVKTRKSAPLLVASARPAQRGKAAAEQPTVVTPQKPVQVATAQPKPPAPAKTVAKPPAPDVAAPKVAAGPAPPRTIAEAAAPKTIEEAATPVAAVADPAPPAVVVAQVEVPAAPIAGSEPEAAPAIDVAKVRRVMVAPRVKVPTAPANQQEARPAEGPGPSPAEPRFATASTLAGPKADRIVAAAPAGQTPPRLDETVVPKAVGDASAVLSAESGSTPASDARQPSTFESQMAALALKLSLPTPAHTDAAPQQVTEAPPSVPPPPSYRLKGPDPIGDLAAAAPEGATPPSRPAPAVTAPGKPLPASTRTTPTPAAGFQIQIGAFGSPAEANSQIAAVRQAAAAVLGGHDGVTLPVIKGDRKLYRARFAGFDSSAAAAACLELRRRQIDCFVMKAE